MYRSRGVAADGRRDDRGGPACRVGRRVAGTVRIAFEVEDSRAPSEQLAEAGAELLGGPVETPWHDVNVRLVAPDGMQLTLFTPA